MTLLICCYAHCFLNLGTRSNLRCLILVLCFTWFDKVSELSRAVLWRQPFCFFSTLHWVAYGRDMGAVYVFFFYYWLTYPDTICHFSVWRTTVPWCESLGMVSLLFIFQFTLADMLMLILNLIWMRHSCGPLSRWQRSLFTFFWIWFEQNAWLCPTFSRSFLCFDTVFCVSFPWTFRFKILV